MLVARDYQTEGVEQIRARVRTGVRSLIAVGPCGSGKTCVAALLIEGALRKGTRSLFLAHRRELIRQTHAKLLDAGIRDKDIGIIMAGVSAVRNAVAEDDDLAWAAARSRPLAPVQLASVDTLRRRAIPNVGLVVSDECHRDSSATRREIAAACPGAIRVGFTATPIGPGGGTLADLYEELIIIARPSVLAARGHVLEPRIFGVSANKALDLRKVRIAKTGDYVEADVEALVDRASVIGDIIEHWHERAASYSTVLFPASIAHSKHCVERFVAAGIPAGHLDGTMSASARNEVLRKLRTREILILASCDCVSEGFDFPALACAIDVSPTRSLVRHMQRMGRILRPLAGKPTPVILDHAGNCSRVYYGNYSGRPTADHAWQLRSRCTAGAGDPSNASCSVTCKHCFAVLDIGTEVCPECGYRFGAADNPRIPGEVDGKLVELTDTLKKPDVRKIAWDEIVATCVERGYKKQWAAFQFKNRFGYWPPFKFPEQPPRVYTPEEKAILWAKLQADEVKHGRKKHWARIEYSRIVHEPAPSERSEVEI